MFGITFEGNRDLRRIYMPPDYQSFPLRKDFYLPDDAARSPGAGVRPMEQTHAPRNAPSHRARPPDAGVTAEPDRPTAMTTTRPTRPPTIPRVTLDRELGVFEPVPPYPPRTEREAEFYTLGDGEMFLNMGPQHPSTHGVLRVVLKLDGEKVVDLDPVLGYLHRGVEKLCENADYHQAISYTRPARVRQLAVQRVGAGHGLREAARRRGPAPRRVHPGPLGRAQPDRQPLPVHGLDGARPRRPDADPVVVHRARRDRRDARRADRPADALQLLPDRRRQRRPQPRVHEPPRRLDEPGDRADRGRATALLNENEIFVRRMRGLGHDRHGDGAADVHDRPEPARDRRAVRHPPGPPVQRLSRARLRHPDPRPRATASRATCCGWTRSSRACGSSTSACTRCRTGR